MYFLSVYFYIRKSVHRRSVVFRRYVLHRSCYNMRTRRHVRRAVYSLTRYAHAYKHNGYQQKQTARAPFSEKEISEQAHRSQRKKHCAAKSKARADYGSEHIKQHGNRQDALMLYIASQLLPCPIFVLYV